MRFERADALALPYAAGSFEAGACQFGIMFFPDLAAGLEEMRRVLRPGGLSACNVWDSLEVNRVAGIAHEAFARGASELYAASPLRRRRVTRTSEAGVELARPPPEIRRRARSISAAG